LDWIGEPNGSTDSLELVRRFDPFAVGPLARDRRYYFFKRALDVTMAALALVVLLPVMALIAMLIAIDSRGPIIYVQKRVGARRWVRAGYSYWKRIRSTSTSFARWCGADPSIHQAFVTAFIEGVSKRRTRTVPNTN
jgi:hypothetical protein